MQYTFAQACHRLAGRTHGMAGADVKEEINEAIQGLAGLSGWECLRKVLRFFSAGPCFALPQGSAGLVRLCVNGRPAALRAPDFRFLQSGPGDLVRPPAGFLPVDVRNVLDDGVKPVIVEPRTPFRLFAVADGGNQPPITVRGLTPEWREVSVEVPVSGVCDPDTGRISTCSDSDADADLYAIPASRTVFHNIVAVVLAPEATEHVTLFAEDAMTGVRFPVALYNPFIRVPSFRHYSIPGVPSGQVVEILAEVRLEPVPLVRDTDVLPFDTLDPIEWMMRARWCMQSGEVDQAGKYQDRAQQWMKAREVAGDQVQTSVVVNNVFANSLGEASLETINI